MTLFPLISASDAVACLWLVQAIHRKHRSHCSNLVIVSAVLRHDALVWTVSGKPCMRNMAAECRQQQEGWPANTEDWEHRLLRELCTLLLRHLVAKSHILPKIRTRRRHFPRWPSAGSKWSSWWRLPFGSLQPILRKCTLWRLGLHSQLLDLLSGKAGES